MSSELINFRSHWSFQASAIWSSVRDFFSKGASLSFAKCIKGSKNRVIEPVKYFLFNSTLLYHGLHRDGMKSDSMVSSLPSSMLVSWELFCITTRTTSTLPKIISWIMAGLYLELNAAYTTTRKSQERGRRAYEQQVNEQKKPKNFNWGSNVMYLQHIYI